MAGNSPELWAQVLVGLPIDWQDASTCREVLARSAQTTYQLTGQPDVPFDREPEYWILHLWQSSGDRVELGGHVGNPDAPFTKLDWPIRERGPLACRYDSRRNRLRHVDTGRIVYGVRLRVALVLPTLTDLGTLDDAQARIAIYRTVLQENPVIRRYKQADTRARELYGDQIKVSPDLFDKATVDQHRYAFKEAGKQLRQLR